MIDNRFLINLVDLDGKIVNNLYKN